MVSSIFLESDDLEEHQRRMEAKYIRAQQKEMRWEEYLTDDAELIVVGYGIVSRVLRSAVDEARKQGMKVGLFRPITLWPFPSKAAGDDRAARGKSSGRRTQQRADGGRRSPRARTANVPSNSTDASAATSRRRRTVDEDGRAHAGCGVRTRSPGRIRPA